MIKTLKNIFLWPLKFLIGTLCLLAILTGLAFFFTEEIFTPIGRFLVVSEEPSSVDAIVILLGASQPDRILKAKELFDAEVASLFVFGTGFVDSSISKLKPDNLAWPSSSKRYTEALKSLGVQDSAIKLVDTSEAYDTSNEPVSYTHLTLPTKA